ncbi:Regulator of protease activity HflC, stomatin/prohibitin superfamily [Jatrophihabitans endophyticus]|uniref:Regulator of protease activity HflC, stomatin/prohibitin superfamily n=1 Tax=Jatrophihabitans endophyticus TaxID=1206085 RepID=A0A1M5RG24_9ACTN|nr:SPFH domain-containing protein [Jatrophihabitans endophyticus]SHH25204.1 Regulator of protease activity HflC, stomatin/prohibitin superfamily [Jatrophihabitans endophyticus]
MATVTRYPFTRHLQVGPTSYVRHLRNGRVAHEGTAAAFWFRPLSAVLSEVPMDDRELPLLFHARTSDFQDVTVQATVTYRVVDPTAATTRLDFAIDPASGRWTNAPLEQLAGMLTESAQQHALDLLTVTPLDTALTDGVRAVRDRIAAGLQGDARLTTTGVAVLDVRVVAIRPEAEVERALQTPTREHIQQDADRATYERRALAVERERAIAENELQNRIELARRTEQLVGQQGANDRRAAEEAAAADRIAVGAEAARTRDLAAVRAEATRADGEAQVAPYRDLDPEVLLALAVRELAANLPNIDHLTVTPDLLAPVLARLGERA